MDREEAVNVAAQRRDRAAFETAIAELEGYCMAAYAPGHQQGHGAREDSTATEDTAEATASCSRPVGSA